MATQPVPSLPNRPQAAPPAPTDTEVLAAASRRQQTLAWMVLWGSFCFFVALAIGGVLLVFSYVESATEARGGRVSTISGTVLLRQPRQLVWTSAGPDAAVTEGYRVRTDGVSQAFVSLFDYSTLQVFTNSEVEMTQLAVGRFNANRAEVVLTLNQGKVHVGVSPAMGRDRSVRVNTPQGHVDLAEGSYTVTVDGGGTRVRVAERGEAVVASAGGTAVLRSGERADLRPDGVTLPTRALEELVYNGDFSQGLTGWRTGNIAGFREGTDIPGTQELLYDDGKLASRFARLGSKGTHSETFIYQDLDRDVTDYKELRLSLDMRIKHQNLSGGGYLGTEYPVLVRLTYRSANNETSAAWGYYSQNSDNNRTDIGAQAPDDQWIHVVIPQNLMTLNPPPQKLVSIQVSASGWDYESLVGNISLTGQ